MNEQLTPITQWHNVSMGREVPNSFDMYFLMADPTAHEHMFMHIRDYGLNLMRNIRAFEPQRIHSDQHYLNLLRAPAVMLEADPTTGELESYPETDDVCIGHVGTYAAMQTDFYRNVLLMDNTGRKYIWRLKSTYRVSIPPNWDEVCDEMHVPVKLSFAYYDNLANQVGSTLNFQFIPRLPNYAVERGVMNQIGLPLHTLSEINPSDGKLLYYYLHEKYSLGSLMGVSTPMSLEMHPYLYNVSLPGTNTTYDIYQWYEGKDIRLQTKSEFERCDWKSYLKNNGTNYVL